MIHLKGGLLKTELVNAGIAISVFKAHNCHSASTSKTKNIGIPFPEILKRGYWSSQNTLLDFMKRKFLIQTEEKTSTSLLQFC